MIDFFHMIPCRVIINWNELIAIVIIIF